MAFLFGGIREFQGIPGDVQDLRGGFADFLSGSDFGNINSTNFLNDPEFVNSVINPIKTLFSQNRVDAFSQAKESSGNLTGSGLGNALGSAARKSATEENALIGNLLNQQSQFNASQFLNAILGFGTAGVGPPTQAFQEGAIGDIASIIAAVQSGGGGGN